jgi:hypothetical protein
MGRALTDDVDEQPAAAMGVLRAMDTYIDWLNDRNALIARLTGPERAAHFPRHPIVPLAAWGPEAARLGIAADADDLAAAAAAFESTPAEIG